MQAAQRRQAILSALRLAQAPLSASALAQRFSVTRQVIVGDIALLRAGGEQIFATPRGYVVTAETPDGTVRRVACVHNAAGTRDELNAMVDCGCAVLDVIVEHPLYGQLTAPLQLYSRYDVAQYMQRMEESGAHPLSALTEGIHLHTVSCPDEAHFLQMRGALAALGILLQDGD